MDIEIEKRKHKREKAALDVQCASFGIDEIFVSADVSGGGIFLNTPSPLASGSDVELSFRLSRTVRTSPARAEWFMHYRASAWAFSFLTRAAKSIWH